MRNVANPNFFRFLHFLCFSLPSTWDRVLICNDANRNLPQSTSPLFLIQKYQIINNNLVPFPALFLIYFFYFYITVFYKFHPHQIFFARVFLPALRKSSACLPICLPACLSSCWSFLREDESNPGLPYSSPARYQLSHAAPCYYK